jgi:hypothetical protein
MEDSNIDLAAVTENLVQEVTPLFDQNKTIEEEEIIVEEDESTKADLSENDAQVTDLVSDLNK